MPPWEQKRYTKVALGLYYVSAAASIVGLLMGFFKFARFTWYLHDMVIGHVLFVILFLLAALHIPGAIQACKWFPIPSHPIPF